VETGGLLLVIVAKSDRLGVSAFERGELIIASN